jgi:hypothetical protein
MKTLKVITASVVLAAASTASADWYGYNPYAAPALTEEQVKQMQENARAQHEAFEKAQKEAFERHQEAMKNWQAQAPAVPAPAHEPFRPFEPTFETPEWVKQLEAQDAAFMNEMPARGEMPAFEEPTFETPAWVKEIEAQQEARMNEMPARGEMPAFEEPAFETPAWVKEIEAQQEASMDEIPAWGDMPEFDATTFEVPDLKEMEERRAQWIKESDERRAQWIKESDERRAASKQRHEEFMKKFRKDSNEEAVEETPAEQQS